MLHRLLNIIFPPQCLVCDGRVATHGAMCGACWQGVAFITDPMCDACGLPFEFDIGKNAMCADCLHTRPPYAHARAAFRYDEKSNRLITRFKYGDHTQLAKIYGQWLTSAGKELLARSDLLIPVPLHYWRFVSRRFNQSAMLAGEISKKTGLLHLPNAIKRTRHTKQQTGLTKPQREENVKNAFTINKRYKQMVKGKNILLIDDVITTGSTIEQCTKALIKAGAAQVNVLTLARAGR